MLKTGCDPFSEPMVNSENGAGLEVWYSASAAAIFIGWYMLGEQLALGVAGDQGADDADDRGDRARLERVPEGERVLLCDPAGASGATAPCPPPAPPAVRKQPAIDVREPGELRRVEHHLGEGLVSSSWWVFGL